MRALSFLPALLLAEAGDAPPAAQPPGAGSPPAGQQPPAPAAPPPGDGAEVRLSSTQLRDRLAEEREKARREFLKAHGLEKPEELKARFDRLKALEDEKLTAEERTKKQLEEATARAQAGDAATATAQAAVDALFATLTDAERAAIDAQEPKSAAERLKLVNFTRALRPAGAPAPAGSVAPPPPATTGNSPAAPRPGAQQTAFQKWQAIPEGSLRRDAFYRNNAAEIEASRPSS